MDSMTMWLIIGSFGVGLLFLKSRKGGNAQKAWELIDGGALVIDVRSKQEFDSGHLSMAKLIPLNDINSKIKKLGKDLDRPIVVYCQTGARAGAAKSTLVRAGFSNVINGGSIQSMQTTKNKLDNQK